jgi:exodeoxyribonuclease V gamma subunit
MRRPLPLAVNAAFAWLGKWSPDAPADRTPARDAARAAYDGTSWQPGERDMNAYLRRVYPDFDALAGSGDFERLAIELLLPLHLAIPSSTRQKASANGDGDAQ